jgi:hydroxylamine reductase
MWPIYKMYFFTWQKVWLLKASPNPTVLTDEASKYIIDSLFITITNANFDKFKITDKIRAGFQLLDQLGNVANAPNCAVWRANTIEEMEAKAPETGILLEANEDVRSLKELLVYGVKGMAAYAEHAWNLGYKNDEVSAFAKEHW